jgi:uncharacterized protein
MDYKTCIATKEFLSINDLVRLVITSNDKIVPDLKKKLPGNELWIKAKKNIIELAIKENIFNDQLNKKNIEIDDLALKIENLYKKEISNNINIAIKAGDVVLGYTKVLDCIKNKLTKILFTASDAGIDGKKKLESACREDIYIFNIFNTDEISNIIGKENTVHLCVKTGNMANIIINSIAQYNNYIR